MNVGEIKVKGIKKNITDKGISWNLYGITPFEPWESQNSVGFKVVSEWTRCNLDSLKPETIIKPFYSKGFRGIAQFSSFTIVKEA